MMWSKATQVDLIKVKNRVMMDLEQSHASRTSRASGVTTKANKDTLSGI